jgi:hypothetical protein
MKVPGTFSAVAALPPMQRLPPHVQLMAAALLQKEKQRGNGNGPMLAQNREGESDGEE